MSEGDSTQDRGMANGRKGRPQHHDPAIGETSIRRKTLVSSLSRIGGFVVEVLSRFWPVSKSEDEILREESERYR